MNYSNILQLFLTHLILKSEIQACMFTQSMFNLQLISWALTKNLLETDLLGRPHQTKNVHIIDSSILPSLPATTIGLVTMANAYRIGFEAKI